MSKTINDISIKDLLPPSIKDDETIKAVRSGMLHMPILAVISAAAAFIHTYLCEVILVVGPIALTARKKTVSRNSD